jgi:hypothetical protein
MHRDSWRFPAYLAALFAISLAIGRAAMAGSQDARLHWFLLCLLSVAATTVPLALGRFGRLTRVVNSRRHGGRHSADPRVRGRAQTHTPT